MTGINPENSEDSSYPLLSRAGKSRNHQTRLQPSATKIPAGIATGHGFFPQEAVATSISSLDRKRKSSMSFAPSPICDSITSRIPVMVEPSHVDNNLRRKIDAGRHEDLTSMVIQFTRRPQPRRVSMCGSSFKKARSESTTREAITLSSTIKQLSAFDPSLFKQLLVLRSTTALKNLPHMPGTKPMVEIIEYLPDEAAAMALFDRNDGTSIQPSLNESDIIKWTIKGNEEINSWLQKKDECVHPVKSGDWNVSWWAVYNPTYAWAKFDSCEVQFNKQTCAFSLKVRTFLYATGKDEHGRPGCICIV